MTDLLAPLQPTLGPNYGPYIPEDHAALLHVIDTPGSVIDANASVPQPDARTQEVLARVLRRSRDRAAQQERLEAELATQREAASGRVVDTIDNLEPVVSAVAIEDLQAASWQAEVAHRRMSRKQRRGAQEPSLTAVLPESAASGVRSRHEVVLEQPGRHRRPGRLSGLVLGSGAHHARRTKLPQVKQVEVFETVTGQTGSEYHKRSAIPFSQVTALDLIEGGGMGDEDVVAEMLYPGENMDGLKRNQRQDVRQYLPLLQTVESLEDELQAGNHNVAYRDEVKVRLFGIQPGETPAQAAFIDAVWKRLNQPWLYGRSVETEPPKKIQHAKVGPSSLAEEVAPLPEPDRFKRQWFKERWQLARSTAGRTRAVLGVTAMALGEVFGPRELPNDQFVVPSKRDLAFNLHRSLPQRMI